MKRAKPLILECFRSGRYRGNTGEEGRKQKKILLDSCQDKVLSPRNEEGKEKLDRRKKYQKAGKLTKSWKLAREFKIFLQENAEKWNKRGNSQSKSRREAGKIVDGQ